MTEPWYISWAHEVGVYFSGSILVGVAFGVWRVSNRSRDTEKGLKVLQDTCTARAEGVTTLVRLEQRVMDLEERRAELTRDFMERLSGIVTSLDRIEMKQEEGRKELDTRIENVMVHFDTKVDTMTTQIRGEMNSNINRINERVNGLVKK